MRIRNHYLEKNQKSERPSNILFVDTEANIQEFPDGKQKQTLRLGYAIHSIRDGEKWYHNGISFKDNCEDFWKLLDNYSTNGYSKTRLYVFAHNMAYDYTILKLDTYLSKRKSEILMRVIDSVFIIRADNIMFLSSTNFYQQSLQKLGEIFGKSKMISPDFKNCNDSELMEYCKRDTEVLAEIMLQHIKFLHDKDLGSFRPTIAGQAFGTFRHRFMNEKLLVHNHLSVLELEKESYRGGRCEVFKMGKHSNIFCLDINSMYPFVMKNEKYPTIIMNEKPLINCSINSMFSAIDNGDFIIANCNIILNKPFLACKREKLFFPIGKIKQTITSPEIEYLRNNPSIGNIEKVNSFVTYTQANIFSKYVDEFYNLRKNPNTNIATQMMCKIMLISLYGKFAQKQSSKLELITNEKEINLYNDLMDIEHTNELFDEPGCKHIRLGEMMYLITDIDGEYSRESMPAIASSVTAFSRNLLWSLMEKAGLDNVLYCDTDSVFVNENGFDNLKSEISQNELGKLKLEKSGNVEIFGAKDYKFNDEIKMKGVKKNAIHLPDGTYKQLQFQTKNIRYRKGTEDGIVILEPVIKKLSRIYDKGIVKNDIVFPLNYSEF